MYDCRYSVKKEMPLKEDDRVRLNNIAVPYEVLSRLGSTNYHAEQESGNGHYGDSSGGVDKTSNCALYLEGVEIDDALN